MTDERSLLKHHFLKQLVFRIDFTNVMEEDIRRILPVYTPTWMHHSDYLLINGEQDNPAYLNSGNNPETIIITQIEQP